MIIAKIANTSFTNFMIMILIFFSKYDSTRGWLD